MAQILYFPATKTDSTIYPREGFLGSEVDTPFTEEAEDLFYMEIMLPANKNHRND